MVFFVLDLGRSISEVELLRGCDGEELGRDTVGAGLETTGLILGFAGGWYGLV